MFKSYRIYSHSIQGRNNPKGYYNIHIEPTGLSGSETAIVCSKEHPTFDEVIDCLKKCVFKADYIGCYSFIYWEYYKEFYKWIKQSFEHNDTLNIRIIKKFYKKALLRWLKFIEYSDDTLYPQNEYFRMMYKEIAKYLS